MAKIKVVRKEQKLQDEMTEDYKNMLRDTGASIIIKEKKGNYSVMSAYSVKPQKK